MKIRQKIGVRRVSTARQKLSKGDRSGEKHSAGELPTQSDARAVALYWYKRGIRTVPIARAGKKPIGGEGWNKLRVEPDTIAEHFPLRCNVGGLWGEPSGGIVDLDLDTEESRLTAQKLFPETFVYGRAGAPASHYLFRCKGIGTKKWQTKQEGTFVEIRSTGSQSVLPPSIHPDQEPYEIYHDVEFAEISPSRLTMLAQRVAAAAFAAYHWPEKGSRHDYILTLTGALLWKGWSPSETTTFCEAVLFAAGSDGEDFERHQRTIRNAIKNHRLGNHIPGWRTLSQWMSGESLGILKSWVGGAGDPDTPPDSLPITNRDSEIPEDLLNVPGLVGEVANWVAQSAIRQQPLFNLAAGLATVAICSRNMFVVDQWKTPLQPYLLMIAPTASGKDAAMTALEEIAYRIGMQDNVFRGFQSYYALLDKLATPPNIALWLWDEAARKLQTASRSQGSQDYQGLTYLLELYGKAARNVSGMPGRRSSIPPLQYPFFTVMAAAQPEQLIAALTESDVQLGLVNRFILLDGGDNPAPVNQRMNSYVPAKLIDKLQAFERLKRPKGRELPFYRVRFESAKVYQRFLNYMNECAEHARPGDGAEIWGRTAQNALICAGIIAVGIDMNNPVITESITDWALRFMNWVASRWQKRVEQSSSRTVTEKGSKYLERIIYQSSQFVGRARGKHERDLARRGITTQSMLYRVARHLRGRELEDTLSSLILSDLIATGEIDGRVCYWPKTIKID